MAIAFNLTKKSLGIANALVGYDRYGDADFDQIFVYYPEDEEYEKIPTAVFDRRYPNRERLRMYFYVDLKEP